MTTTDVKPDDLTNEKSLWDIYLNSRAIPATRFNRAVIGLTLILLILDALISVRPTAAYLGDVRSMSESGLQIGLSTLGFLIAGFTIFATISKPALLISMSRIKHPDLPMSYLKKNFYVFMRAFIYYISFCFFCFFVYFLSRPGGLGSSLINLLPHSEELKCGIVRISYMLTVLFYIVILLQLKSFVFNTYHSVMTALRWDATNEQETSVPADD